MATVADLAKPGRSWGEELGAFKASGRYTETDSYQWKNLIEKALLAVPSLSSSGAPVTANRPSPGGTCQEGGVSIVGRLTNGEVIMGIALAGYHPSFGPKSRREVNARFKATLQP